MGPSIGLFFVMNNSPLSFPGKIEFPYLCSTQIFYIEKQKITY